ncbi:MAG TPA: hypothetical protein VMR33_06355 [Candidatus Baltobacteraceae bacterium]|nr:hypothetical protein [Candidatus Baltobacteraceae bacterium]
MKTQSTMLAATAGAILVAGLCQTAQANLIGDTTLHNGGNTIVVDSSAVLQTSGPETGDYLYTYSFNDAIAAGLASYTVYFPTATAGVFGVAGATTDPITFDSINNGDVNWEFNNAGPYTGGAESVWFYSPLAPALGDTSGQDGGLWGNGTGAVQFGVVVPNVPDGGMTMTLLGGSLMVLQALRRKLAR